MPATTYAIAMLMAFCVEPTRAGSSRVTIHPFHFASVGPISHCGGLEYNVTVTDGVSVDVLVVDDAGLQACKTALSVFGSFDTSQEGVISKHIDTKFASINMEKWDGDRHIVIDNTYLMTTHWFSSATVSVSAFVNVEDQSCHCRSPNSIAKEGCGQFGVAWLDFLCNYVHVRLRYAIWGVPLAVLLACMIHPAGDLGHAMLFWAAI